MDSVESFAKIPLLLAIIWAHHVTFTSPNPFAPATEGSTVPPFVRRMRPIWHRNISIAVTRSIVLAEALVILAARIPTVASTYLLSVFFHNRPEINAAECLRITPAFALGWVIMICGALIRRACYREMGKNFTFEITIHKDHNLVTSGPYSIVRHPSYSAFTLVVLGTVLCFFSGGSWLRESGILTGPMGTVFAVIWAADILYIPVVMIFLRVKAEDDLLRREFGKEWEDWARRTPYVLVPGIY